MSDTNISGIFILQEVRERILAGVWPTTAPAVTTPIADMSTINEGGSVIINVNTKDYEGQTLYWTISGVTGTINSSDFTAISGSFVVQSNNFGFFTITTTEDVTTEGTESFVVQIRSNSTSGPIKATSETITINDTSIYNAIYGWFGGGGGPVSTVDRITFASDTAAAITRGPLSSARRMIGATGDKNFGWFGGGSTPAGAYRSIIDRITFVTDSSTAASRGPLSLARDGIDGSSNDNFGWFGGGFTATGGTSIVDRITFASDGSTTSTRGTLSTARGFLASTGNSNYGWFGGGTGGAPPFSLVDRIDFADDTPTASVRGPLFYRAGRLSATGNQEYGWFAGGQFSPTENQMTYVARITFVNDTATAPSRTTLSVARNSLSATGNNDYGWFGGGVTPTTSSVERITFSDDTATTSVRGPLSSVRYGMGSTSGGV